MRWFIISLVVILAGGTAFAFYWHSASIPKFEFKTAQVRRGDLTWSINATGTVEPEEVVDVGAQVSGLIESFGKDSDGRSIDYRSPVEPGMLLARIDDAVYQADLETAKAQLDQAFSNQKKGQADLELAKAKRDQAQENWERAEKLGPSDALSQSDYDMYRAEFRSAQASVAIADAEVTQALASVRLAQAAVQKAQRNVDFCTIRSPVQGVIIDRRVNAGQTIVSGLSASSMFLIAKDLRRLQVLVAVNEADIDRIKPGQVVSFSCDALPGESFKGVVGKVRLNAQSTQNVVIYNVEVNTDNSSGRLLPYFTANVEFEVSKEVNALQVPNSALRWYPLSADEVAPDSRSQWKPVEEDDEPAPPAQLPKPLKPGPKKPVERHGTVWVRDGRMFGRLI